MFVKILIEYDFAISISHDTYFMIYRAEKNNFLAEKEVIPTQLENVAIDDMSITDIKNLNKEVTIN